MSISSSRPQKIKLTAFGPTGDGKSQFLSMLYGQEVFAIGHTGESRTIRSSRVDCVINNQHLRLIDQPGISTLGQMEQGHLDTMHLSLKREGSINAICLCIRASRNRVDFAIQTTLRYLRNIKQLKKTQFLNRMLPIMNKEIDELFENQRSDHGDLPIFVFDTSINPNSTTKAEKERFLAHVATLSAISTSDINRFDARYKLVTEEIIEETRPGTPRRHMITIVRNGIQEDPESEEMMPVTIHQKKKQLKQECWEEDKNGDPVTSFRMLGPVDEPWETVDDNHIRVFKKEFSTKTNFLGGILQRQKSFDRNGKCIETSDWTQIKNNTESVGGVIGNILTGIGVAVAAVLHFRDGGRASSASLE
ncbi:hypothetical protein BLNAU_20909 [Blattamonas nauphoetae]|uniref:G domain-containing protein n=1 Tax=Blattamonas nauphoetae TaxID=2049346 RepID=A0ABQ9WXC4_9EUKA|nr:hypothetical protein BLNAU_20909 [Blattamonas nauphoetae]